MIPNTMIRKIKQKEFWRQGSGEIIGFLCVLPVIIFMLSLFVSIVQIGSLEEQLDYVVYNACRQAIVVRDENEDDDYMDDAEDLIKTYVEEELGDVKKISFTDEDIVDLAIVNSAADVVDTLDGTVYTSNKASAKDSSSDEETADGDWIKGSYLRCTVSAYIESPLDFMSGTKYSTIVMMIERPTDEDGEDYPWFRNM